MHAVSINSNPLLKGWLRTLHSVMSKMMENGTKTMH